MFWKDEAVKNQNKWDGWTWQDFVVGISDGIAGTSVSGGNPVAAVLVEVYGSGIVSTWLAATSD